MQKVPRVTLVPEENQEDLAIQEKTAPPVFQELQVVRVRLECQARAEDRDTKARREIRV